MHFNYCMLQVTCAMVVQSQDEGTIRQGVDLVQTALLMLQGSCLGFKWKDMAKCCRLWVTTAYQPDRPPSA